MKTAIRFIQFLIVLMAMQFQAMAQSDAEIVAALKKSQWVLASLGDIKKVGLSVPLSIDGDKAYGTDGCNRFSGSIEWGAANAMRFKSGNAAMTMMACWGEAESISQAFRKVLSDTRSYSLLAETLLLKSEQGHVLATYEKQDKKIVGTQWQIQGVNNGFMGVVMSEDVQALSIEFKAAGEWRASSDCIEILGRYEANAVNGAISLSAEKVTELSCTNSRGKKSAVSHFLSSIKRTVSYGREGNSLELRSRGGSLQISANIKK